MCGFYRGVKKLHKANMLRGNNCGHKNHQVNYPTIILGNICLRFVQFDSKLYHVIELISNLWVKGMDKNTRNQICFIGSGLFLVILGLSLLVFYM
jgi:hypothetical protein